MVLTVKSLIDNMKHSLGGAFPGEVEELSVLNQAGEHLHSMHAWRFAQGRSTLLSLRGTVSGTAATWDGTSTLTKSAAFTNYTFVDGDEIEITGGTGVTAGFYEVASRVSANAITLTADIGAAAADVAFTLQPYSIDIPDDTRDIIAIQGTGGSTWNNVTLTSLAEVLRVREFGGLNDAHSYAAIAYVGTPPTPVLEIAPGAGSNATGALRMFYRSRWARLSTDSTLIDVPEFCEALLLQICRAFARGYVREDVSSLDERLAIIHAGPVFQAARRSDGAIQPYFKTQGGIQRWRRPAEMSDWRETTSRVSPPS